MTPEIPLSFFDGNWFVKIRRPRRALRRPDLVRTPAGRALAKLQMVKTTKGKRKLAVRRRA